jgi:hypothetical protein
MPPMTRFLRPTINKHAADDALFAADDGTPLVWMALAGAVTLEPPNTCQLVPSETR